MITRRQILEGFLVASSMAILAAGCREPRLVQDDDLAPPPGDPDGLRDELVPAIGSDATLDLATWNIENFPKRYFTPALSADLIASLRLDIVALEEIADIDAFEELVAHLPDHEGVLSPHVYSSGEYQKLAVVYRSDLLEVVSTSLLFEGDTYAFPRPALQVDFKLAPAAGVEFDFTIIAVHLKAGVSASDARRRMQAFEMLDDHVRDVLSGSGDHDIVILGDFNEVLDTQGGRDVWSPLLAAPDLYMIQTQAASDNLEYSWLPLGRLLDHIVSTTSLADEFAGRDARIPRLDQDVVEFENTVSDHLPVVISMPLSLSTPDAPSDLP